MKATGSTGKGSTVTVHYQTCITYQFTPFTSKRYKVIPEHRGQI